VSAGPAAHRFAKACHLDSLGDDSRVLVEVEGRRLGIFRVGGRVVAVHDRCPHQGGPVCRGVLSGTTMPVNAHEYRWGREGAILSCPWHGWEFDLETGAMFGNPRIRLRTYETRVDDDGYVYVRVQVREGRDE